MSDQKIRVAITHGDVNGIGCEIIIKTLMDSRMSELCTPIVYGSSKAMAEYRKAVEGAENFNFSIISSARDARPRRVNLINCADENLKLEPGRQTPEAGAAAVAALKRAVADIKAGLADVLVTAPINKENVQGEDFNFTGHTEFLAAEFGGEPLMIMAAEGLRVGLVTIHMPVSQVSSHVTKAKVTERLGQLRRSLIEDFGVVEPRIAVMALNPHAGDGGMLGTEEKEIIRPAIDDAAKNKVLAFGPMAADGLFASGAYRCYDAVLAMYHDQGLAPFKALCPDGVNVTASLKVVRTSPDHGTAYDIAGHGIADPSSMRNAIYMALDIHRARERWAEMSRNPLKRYERERGADVSVKDLPQTDPES
ncbi:MAG: 4-hydroxythreonine-4-phosphate dehydrogenase PdxA [Rikenellaceae bacterium]|jgi:4-hydroxythreonine-4-phosphate dehydrogenase|nr:4-hydroxythreonine-4-phosphate dehydrogenase PdxA [Rikenellaceae bacterium]